MNCQLELPEHARAIDAINFSGIKESPHWQDNLSIFINGGKADENKLLADMDNISLLPPVLVNPKQRRKNLAEQQQKN